jgi:hypothetical protein
MRCGTEATADQCDTTPLAGAIFIALQIGCRGHCEVNPCLSVDNDTVDERIKGDRPRDLAYRDVPIRREAVVAFGVSDEEMNAILGYFSSSSSSFQRNLSSRFRCAVVIIDVSVAVSTELSARSVPMMIVPVGPVATLFRSRG